MVARLVVVLFILVCLMVGFILILFPWFDFGGLGSWRDNFLLTFIVDLTGIEMIRTVVISNWFKGAVTGLGVFNIFLAFWEVANFEDNVKALENG